MFNADLQYIRLKGPLKFLKHVLVEQQREILLLDENQVGSTTVALAAARGSFDGIWSSSKTPETLTAFRLSQQIINNRDFFVIHHQNDRCTYQSDCQPDDDEWWLALDSQIESLDPSQLRRMDMKFSAAKLQEPSTDGVPKQFIWLNFPWCEPKSDLASYIVDFIRSCAAVQAGGGIVLLTLTEDDMWTSHYGDIVALVRIAEGLGYSHYEDEYFVRAIMQHYGYQHRTANDAFVIHHHVVPNSTTHIFIKTPIVFWYRMFLRGIVLYSILLQLFGVYYWA